MVHIRRLHVLATIGCLIVVGAISLSDRYVPAASRAFTNTTSGATSAATDRTLGPLSFPDLPIGWDTLTHFMLWFGVGLLAAGLIRRAYQLPLLWLAIFAVSAGVELAQKYWTDGRQMQTADLVANGLGAAVGLGVGLAVLFVELVLARIFRWFSGLRQTRSARPTNHL